MTVRLLREETLPFRTPERAIKACEHAKFRMGPRGLIVEDCLESKQVVWLIRLVELEESYDANWKYIGFYEDYGSNSYRLYGVLCKRG